MLTFARGSQRYDSERRGEDFVRALGGKAQIFDSPIAVDRPACMGTVVQPGFLLWLNIEPAVSQPGESAAAGGPQVPVQWQTIRSPDKRLKWIDDDGPGIPEDKMEQAFLPFVRLEESRSRATGGSGLGLAITRSIILNHGGDIALMNRPEGGLRATITLPKSLAAER